MAEPVAEPMAEPKSVGVEHEGIDAAPNDAVHLVAGHGETAKREGAKTKDVYNAELFAAIEETKIPTWSKTSIHLYFCIFVAFACACANGYDGSLMGSLYAMNYFQSTFKTGLTGSLVSLTTSLYTVGSMVAAPFSAVISDNFGRRKCMFAGGWIIIIGSIVVATASTVAQFVVGRFILGAGIQVMVVSAPAYAVEISLRTGVAVLSVRFYNCGWFGGSIPAAFITYGCNYINNDYQWRIPIILQCFACIIVIIAVWFIPESPRWLMAHDRDDEAIAFLVKYHGNGDQNSRLVRLEVEEMKEGIRIDGIDKRWWDYRPFLFSHSSRWRFLQVIMISVFGQWSGNGVGYFNSAIFNEIGYKTSQMELLLNVVNSIVSAIGALTAVHFTDRMPRRKVLVPGTFLCAVTLAVFAGVCIPQARTGSLSYASGQVALTFYYLFNIIFSFTYTPLQGVIPAEALETTTRAKGLALSGFIVSLIGFISQFATPIGIANISTNYIWIFVGWDVFESFIWWLCCVESQGRTLEELEWVYQQPNPVKASKHLDKVVVQADGTVTEKIAEDL